MEFNEGYKSMAIYDLNGTLSYQSADIEDAGQLLFDFVEIEDSV